MTAFLRRHSQKLAATAFFGGALLSYAAQPHLEVLTRWHHMKTSNGREMPPTKRVLTIANRAFEKIGMSSGQQQKVDIFLTDAGESVALGVVGNGDYATYAFIGIPYFAIYDDENFIPLEGLHFASPVFPFLAYSAIGRKRLQLMRLSEKALEFLIAREAMRLIAPVNPRLSARITSLSFLITTYLAYQFCYLARVLGLSSAWPLHLRFLGYCGVTGLMFLCQRQLLVAWRQHACFALDRRTCEASPDLVEGALIYYAWKLEWNRFWSASVLPAGWKAMDLLRQVSRGIQTDHLPALNRHQLRMALNDSTFLHRDAADYYFIPPSVEYPGRHEIADCGGGSSSSQISLRLDDCDLQYLDRMRLPPYAPTNARTGDEKFASDGEALQLGLSGLLSFGAFPSVLAALCELISAPATCTQRIRRLEAQLLDRAA